MGRGGMSLIIVIIFIFHLTCSGGYSLSGFLSVITPPGSLLVYLSLIYIYLCISVFIFRFPFHQILKLLSK